MSLDEDWGRKLEPVAFGNAFVRQDITALYLVTVCPQTSAAGCFSPCAWRTPADHRTATGGSRHSEFRLFDSPRTVRHVSRL